MVAKVLKLEALRPRGRDKRESYWEAVLVLASTAGSILRLKAKTEELYPHLAEHTVFASLSFPGRLRVIISLKHRRWNVRPHSVLRSES